MSYLIGARLKAYREKYGVEMPEIEKATGISRHKMYKWENGKSPRKQSDFLTLSNYLDEMEKKKQSVSDNNIEYERNKTATLRLPLDPAKAATSQLSGKAAAGTLIRENDIPELIVDRIEAPFLGNVEGVVEVTDENMEPTFKKGCRVAVTRLKHKQILKWGECYFIIDKNGEGSVSRVYQGEAENSILLVSDNPDKEKYPTFQRNLDQIEAILKVKAGILKY